MNIDPKLDLVLERTVAVPPELVWKAWTTPEHLTPWFCPRPWTTTECVIELRPGGAFNTVMRSPEGKEFPELGCVLEVVPNRRFVFTSALEAGFRPARKRAPFQMTAFILLEPHGDGGTKYTAIVKHADESGREQHEAMGFSEGWAKALEQLVEYVKSTML